MSVEGIQSAFLLLFFAVFAFVFVFVLCFFLLLVWDDDQEEGIRMQKKLG